MDLPTSEGAHVKRPLFRKRLPWIAVGAVAMAAVLVPAALADKPTTKPNDAKQKPVASEKSWVKLGGGRAYGTYLVLDAGFASALTGPGVTVTVLKPAKDTTGTSGMGIRFPITQGKLVLMTSGQPAVLSGMKGTIGHVGGLKLVQGKKVVRVRNFVIVVDTSKDVAKVTAQVNGKRIWFATLTSFTLPELKGKKVTVEKVELTLSEMAATALNGAFGSSLSMGAKVGTATVQARLVGKGKTAG
jgi:hypothetical protein